MTHPHLHAERPWTDDETRELIRLRQQGAPRRQVCEALGRSPASVKSRSSRLIRDGLMDRAPVKGGTARGAYKRAWTPEEDAVIQAGVARKAIIREIVTELHALPGSEKRTAEGVEHRIKRLRRGVRPYSPAAVDVQAKREAARKKREAKARMAEISRAQRPLPAEAAAPVTPKPRHKGKGGFGWVPTGRPQRGLDLRGYHFQGPSLRLQSDKAEMSAWLDAAACADFDDAMDLHLIGCLMSGAMSYQAWAQRHGLTPERVVERFRLLTAPVRIVRSGAVDSEGVEVITALLRTRLAAEEAA